MKLMNTHTHTSGALKWNVEYSTENEKNERHSTRSIFRNSIVENWNYSSHFFFSRSLESYCGFLTEFDLKDFWRKNVRCFRWNCYGDEMCWLSNSFMHSFKLHNEQIFIMFARKMIISRHEMFRSIPGPRASGVNWLFAICSSIMLENRISNEN